MGKKTSIILICSSLIVVIFGVIFTVNIINYKKNELSGISSISENLKKESKTSLNQINLSRNNSNTTATTKMTMTELPNSTVSNKEGMTNGDSTIEISNLAEETTVIEKGTNSKVSTSALVTSIKSIIVNLSAQTTTQIVTTSMKQTTKSTTGTTSIGATTISETTTQSIIKPTPTPKPGELTEEMRAIFENVEGVVKDSNEVLVHSDNGKVEINKINWDISNENYNIDYLLTIRKYDNQQALNSIEFVLSQYYPTGYKEIYDELKKIIEASVTPVTPGKALAEYTGYYDNRIVRIFKTPQGTAIQMGIPGVVY